MWYRLTVRRNACAETLYEPKFCSRITLHPFCPICTERLGLRGQKGDQSAISIVTSKLRTLLVDLTVADAVEINVHIIIASRLSRLTRCRANGFTFSPGHLGQGPAIEVEPVS